MKKLTILLIAVMTTMVGYAQLPLLSGRMSGQEITCKAVEGSLYLTKASYRLKEKASGKFFGRDGKADFGAGYGVAVKTEDGILMPTSSMMPWNNDKDYQKVSNKYDGILSTISICSLTDNEFLPATKPSTMDGMYQVIDPQSKDGLIIGTPEAGELNGWCVWITTNVSAIGELASDKVKCQANTKTITLTDTTKVVDAGNVPAGVTVLGGIFVYPEYCGGGVVKYKMVGFLEKSFDKWNICIPFLAQKPQASSTTTEIVEVTETPETPAAEEEEVRITPVEGADDMYSPSGKDKKKKKK